MSDSEKGEEKVRLINAYLLLDVLDFTHKNILKSSISSSDKSAIDKAYSMYRECVVKSPTFT